MSDQFVGEIRAFPFDFAPVGWALCDGTLLKIKDHSAMFALLGVTYGGDGRESFALPDLRGRAPLAFGQGNGLNAYDLGEAAGFPTVTLSAAEIPEHTHGVQAAAFPASTGVPSDTASLAPANADLYSENTASLQPMQQESLAPTGGGAPHTNMAPYVTFTFCIAMQGVYPQRP